MKKERRQYDLRDIDDAGMKRRMHLFGLFSLLIVPLYTLLFASQDSLITSNISYIGNMPGNYGRLVLWGAVCTVFFYLFFTFLFSLLQYKNRHAWNIFHLACILFMLTVLLPFVPGVYPISTELHNQFAQAATLLTLVATLMLTLHIKTLDKEVYTKSIRLWIINLIVCFAFLIATGISGLVEVLFIAATCTQLFSIMYWVTRSSRIAERIRANAQDKMLPHSIPT